MEDRVKSLEEFAKDARDRLERVETRLDDARDRPVRVDMCLDDARDRLVRIETRLDTFATKEDLHRELHATTWRIIGATVALCAAVFWLARNVAPPPQLIQPASRSQQTQAATQPVPFPAAKPSGS